MEIEVRGDFERSISMFRRLSQPIIKEVGLREYFLSKAERRKRKDRLAFERKKRKIARTEARQTGYRYFETG